jgi:hypothetical protein
MFGSDTGKDKDKAEEVQGSLVYFSIQPSSNTYHKTIEIAL